MRIVFFGDSLTAGTYGANFVDKVAAALPDHEIINAGVNGDTSLNLRDRLASDVLAHQPDAVFILVGINDATAYSEPGTRPYYRLGKHVPEGILTPDDYRENMRTMLTQLAAAGIRRVWVGLSPVEVRPVLVAAVQQFNTELAALCRELDVPALDMFTPLVPEAVPERPSMGIGHFRKVAETKLTGSPYDRLRDTGGYTYTFDGIHLTEGGAARFADLILAFLREQGAL
jgi:lysophospholipase L1-like esterase